MLNELQKKTVTVVIPQVLKVEQRCEKNNNPTTYNQRHDALLTPKHKLSHSLQASVEVN